MVDFNMQKCNDDYKTRDLLIIYDFNSSFYLFLLTKIQTEVDEKSRFGFISKLL